MSSEHSSKNKSNTDDLAFKDQFNYSHKNPYHDRLKTFDQFVMRDTESEDYQSKWSTEVFSNNNALEVEIGTGYGHFMLSYTQSHPELNFVGLDHRFKRSFSLAKKLSKLESKNFRYLRARAERIGFIFGENEIDKLFYFFPDPWPKARHHKKRLFQLRFLAEAQKVLKKEGQFLIKTDHDQYFEWMLEELSKQNYFSIKMKTFDLYTEQPNHFLASFQTKFEKIFLEKGIKIKALELINTKGEND